MCIWSWSTGQMTTKSANEIIYIYMKIRVLCFFPPETPCYCFRRVNISSLTSTSARRVWYQQSTEWNPWFLAQAITHSLASIFCFSFFWHISNRYSATETCRSIQRIFVFLSLSLSLSLILSHTHLYSLYFLPPFPFPNFWLTASSIKDIIFRFYQSLFLSISSSWQNLDGWEGNCCSADNFCLPAEQGVSNRVL